MSATNCLSHQLVTKQVWGNPTGDKPLPGRTACRGPAPRACSVSPTLRGAASLGRVEMRPSMSRMLRLEGAVPELSFAHPSRAGANSVARRTTQSSGTRTQQHEPRHGPSPSPTSSAARPWPPADCAVPGMQEPGRGGPLPSPLLLLVKQNQSQFYCLIFVTQTEVSYKGFILSQRLLT